MTDEKENNRLDLWLKLCCIFKHRSDAAEACRGGLVKLNGSRAKPAATVKPGDVIEISGGERQRKLIVEAIPRGSVAKDVARTMYLDQSPPPPPRDPYHAPVMAREKGSGRPTKRERREIHRFTEFRKAKSEK